jgi:proline dehydrogenase
MVKKKKFPLFPLLAALIVAGWALYQYGERWMRHILIYLSGADWAKELITSIPVTRRVAARFVAGETIEEAITAAATLHEKGMRVTLDYLGENVSIPDDAIAARSEIMRLLDQIAASGLPHASVSVKLTQLGLRISEELALENMRHLLTHAREQDNWIRIDMEESAVTDATLRVFRRLRQEFDNVGIVIQAYLHRSEDDVRELIAQGDPVRLCKGAYAEPPAVAFQDKEKTDANFIHLTKMMLGEEARQNGVYLGVATHDEAMIEATIDYVKEHGIPGDAFEFQMLYGIRRELQETLVDEGYRVRIYVPYGASWYAYFVRRLAERPANIWFFLSNFLRK